MILISTIWPVIHRLRVGAGGAGGAGAGGGGSGREHPHKDRVRAQKGSPGWVTFSLRPARAVVEGIRLAWSLRRIVPKPR